jgi:alpha-L-fucosidase
MKKYITSLLLLIFSISANSQNVDAKILTEENNPKMMWWKDAKFGMFIHWGIYAVPAGKWENTTTYGEWIMHTAKIPRTTYSALAKEFNPSKFNAEEWVKLAKSAGQKYIVITSKHMMDLPCLALKHPLTISLMQRLLNVIYLRN